MLEKITVGNAELRRWTRGVSSFLVNLEDGARLLNWNLTMGDGDVRDVLYWAENYPCSGKEFSDSRGGAKILFPFAGVSYDCGKSGVWKTPDGEVLQMKSDGLVPDGKFECVEENDFGFTAKFIPNSECRASYPYDYELSVTYRFDEFAVTCALCVKNTGTCELPWGGGMQMFFAVPWHAGLTRSAYRILSDAKKAYKMDSSGGFIPVTAPESESLDSEMLSGKIRARFKTAEIRLGPRNGEEDLLIKINGGGKPEMGICAVSLSDSDDAPYYSISALSAHPNCAADKKAMRTIKAGQSETFMVEILFA